MVHLWTYRICWDDMFRKAFAKRSDFNDEVAMDKLIEIPKMQVMMAFVNTAASGHFDFYEYEGCDLNKTFQLTKRLYKNEEDRGI